MRRLGSATDAARCGRRRNPRAWRARSRRKQPGFPSTNARSTRPISAEGSAGACRSTTSPMRSRSRSRSASLGKSPRAAAVLRNVATRVWGKPLPGTSQGVAVAFWNGSYAALIADVALEGKKPRVKRAVIAVDCGIAINPEIIVAQTESAINYGLAAALTGKITLKNGRVEQNNFYDYTVLRIPDAPHIEVSVLPSRADPTGIGELGTPPIAPAVANAIFAARGTRVRSLPLSDALAL